MDNIMKFVRFACVSSFQMCTSMFGKKTQTAPVEHDEEEQATMKPISKTQSTVPEEKWENEFTQWSHQSKSKSVPEVQKADPKKKIVDLVDERALIEKKVKYTQILIEIC
eukprot:TRINITY_DN882_c0_g1_i9.p2 TRINITY_DN882_c0_g1~~TRINITY_DN882_c0_g1_i9.p2  ORF type:complete len:110 (+),score=21.64 TRINITY_DN882_c0_g1_i9:208-537(+)